MREGEEKEKLRKMEEKTRREELFGGRKNCIDYVIMSFK